MAIHTEPQVLELYGEDEEELSQTFFHEVCIYTLMSILKSLFKDLEVGVTTNVRVYAKGKKTDPLAPDIVVVDGYVPETIPSNEPGSYYITDTNPPPRVIFEMTSDETWANDVKLPHEVTPGEKVTPNGNPHRVRPKQPRYEAMGIQEYFIFDPHEPTVWTRKWKQENRLMGWRLNVEGKYERIPKNEDGWMWSEQLNHWLVANGRFLQLYDENRNRFLNDSERAEAQRQKAEQLEREKKAAQQKSEQLEREKEVERQAKEAAQRHAEQLAEKLRKLGIDPDA
jgi:Putative restriction endonuclease